jgi:hypothetical protein
VSKARGVRRVAIVREEDAAVDVDVSSSPPNVVAEDGTSTTTVAAADDDKRDYSRAGWRARRKTGEDETSTVAPPPPPQVGSVAWVARETRAILNRVAPDTVEKSIVRLKATLDEARRGESDESFRDACDAAGALVAARATREPRYARAHASMMTASPPLPGELRDAAVRAAMRTFEAPRR